MQFFKNILEDNFQYGPVLFGSLGVAVTVVPISPLFTAPEIARVGVFYLNFIVTVTVSSLIHGCFTN